jgi:UDP-N-acetylmuramoylalanine--D-glutamate ligase
MKADLKDKKVLVIGSGLSGVGSVNLLNKVGAIPVMLEENTKVSEADIRNKLHEEDRDKTTIIIGEISDEVLDTIALTVPSPAVPLDAPTVMRIKGKNIPIWSEIELAYNFAKGKVVAITGTNGKTTTTTLVGEIMKAHFGKCYVVGNIGVSYAESALEMDENSVTVGEISSFQLEAVDNFHANVSAILNITPDHLNRHHTMENYIRAKEAIVRNQTKKDTVVLNYDDEELRHFGSLMVAKVMFFSSSQELDEGLFLRDDAIWIKKDGVEEEVIKTDDLNLLGTHNFENVMAAVAIGQAMGVPMDSMRSTLRRFTAVEHRIEYVCDKRGVAFYNDSKGTNPDAAIKAVLAMNRPIVLIGGGFDKASEYDTWVETFEGRVKKLVLIGQTADAIEACCREHGFTKVERASSLENAVLVAYGAARSGDCVLLSPACASWDMFPNYEVRGNEFKSLAKGLPD